MKIYRLSFLILVFALAASGCISSSSEPGPSDRQQAQSTGLEGAAFYGLEELPDHARAVIAIVLGGLRDKEPKLRDVRFRPDGVRDISPGDMDYTGYTVKLIDIERYMAAPAGGGADVSLGGTVVFANALGQTSMERFFAEYELRPGKPVMVNEIFTFPRYAKIPEVHAYYVPVEDMLAAKDSLRDFDDYYLFAAGYSIPMFASEAESAAYRAHQEKSFFERASDPLEDGPVLEEEVAILVFVMDRIEPLGFLEIRITGDEDGDGESIAEAVYLQNRQGYTMALGRGNAVLYDESNPFYVHAMYHSAKGGKETVRQVGRFCSMKYYEQPVRMDAYPGSEAIVAQAVQSQNRKAVAPAAAKAQSGERLLDLRDRQDARMVQQMLAKLGYYNSSIDGLFGKGSKAALQAFRRDVMGADSVAWDIATQKALFAKAR